ncbi:MAG TPA: glycosyltransferase, partial [Nitrospiria bacterium]|nr:glycosyltransferase [Nitrospiria bacterium]
MKILMFTNTFPPHVGGVAHSVASFMEDYRRLGHRVLVVAPIFPGTPAKEKGIVRIPAIQNFNGSDFSVRLPIPSFLFPKLDGFEPDVIHSHHPFLLGDTALRVAAWKKAPLVFTHHTMYERYTHYVPGDSPQMKRFVKELSTGYANLSDAVIAPSESIAEILRGRGVETPITEIPTGVDLSEFEKGDGEGFRRRHGIPEDAFVVGHLGRLAPEKNLVFLARAMNRFLKRDPTAHAVIAGSGPIQEELKRIFAKGGNSGRCHLIGTVLPADRTHAYHAMNVFAFASQTETQGMVL